MTFEWNPRCELQRPVKPWRRKSAHLYAATGTVLTVRSPVARTDWLWVLGTALQGTCALALAAGMLWLVLP